jgi:hypothetical protein
MKRELLERVGIDPDQPAAAQAAALVRALPLRFDRVTGQRDPSSALESGWFAGAGECVRVMSELFRGDTGRGTAFGGPWPYMMSGGRLVAPALPVVLGGTQADGPDGCYRLREGVVFREAVGRERPLLTMSKGVSDEGSGFDLLWFGDAARYLVRAGRIEVEDLFSVMRVSASARALDRLLIRVRQVDPAVVEDVPLADSAPEPAEIEVRRSRELLAGEDWRDPQRLFAGKAGVQRTAVDRDQLKVEMDGGQDVVFNIVEERNGWRAFVWQGRYPFQLLALSVSDRTVAFTGTLRADLDPLTHSLRERLAFELHADLVALGGGTPRVDHSS